VGLTLHLVRHGATEWSDAGRFNGWTDVSLNATGVEQAHSLREALPLRADIPIWSSDLVRATMTAAILGPYRVDRRLREIDFGTLEGLTWDRCAAEVQQALLDFDRFAAPGGESVVDLTARVDDFLAEIARDEKGSHEHVVVTHGGVIRALLRRTATDAIVRPGTFVTVEVDVAVAAESPPAHNR